MTNNPLQLANQLESISHQTEWDGDFELLQRSANALRDMINLLKARQKGSHGICCISIASDKPCDCGYNDTDLLLNRK